MKNHGYWEIERKQEKSESEFKGHYVHGVMRCFLVLKEIPLKIRRLITEPGVDSPLHKSEIALKKGFRHQNLSN